MLWPTVVFRAPSATRGVRQRQLWFLLLVIALAQTIVLPPVAELVDDVSNWRGGTTLLHHLLFVCGGVALLRFLSLTANRDAVRRARRRQQLYGALVSVVLSGIFLTSSRDIEAEVEKTLAMADLSGTAILYWTVLQGYLSATLILATVTLWRIGTASTAGPLPLGLRVVGLGTLINAVHAVLKAFCILAHAAGVDVPPEAAARTLDAFLALSAILVVAGCAVPVTTLVWTIIQVHRTRESLSALWWLMRGLFPEIVLPCQYGSHRHLVSLAEIQLLLYRRIIEIRDGMLQLRAFIPADAADDAARFLRRCAVPASDYPALVEACRIELGIRRMRAGAVAGAGVQLVDGGTSIEEEADWLSRVSRAVAHSPYPELFVEWWEHEHVRETAR